MKRALLALLCGLALSGCLEPDPPPPATGYVTAAAYDDPDDYNVSVDDYGYRCEQEYGYNSQTGKFEYHNECKDRVVGHHYEHRHDGPHWTLTLRDDRDKKHTGTIEVTETDYEEHPVGTHYPDLR